MGLKCDSDFSDVDAYFSEGKWEVQKAMIEAGDNAVKYAKEHGNYHDRTGTLRKSNRYKVEDDCLTLFNDATSPQGYRYASNVESKCDVLSSAALNAERELKDKFER